MDFKNSDIASGSVLTSLNGADASASLESAALLQMAIQAGNIMPLTADGRLVLPAGVGIDDITVVGRNLIIQMPDGTQIIVPDGAVFVPQIIVDGVAVPPLNIAALLIGQEGPPRAGLPQSSGGNFAEAVGNIGDPFALGDLLPPTQLAFPEPELREIVPGLVDRDPDVLIQDGGPAGRDVTDNVSETGLPGTRPNGNIESPGSAAGNGSDRTTGIIIVASPDGISSITVNGVTLTGVAGQQITTARGVLTLGTLNSDQIAYTYQLTDNSVGDATTDLFTVTVTDPDGDVASARLTINIADDGPTARNDTDSVAGGTFGPELGNVLSGAGTTSGSAGADTLGADGASISGVRAGASGAFAAVGATINGQYGTLTLGANGSYTYVRNVNTPGGVSDVFTYQLTDGDGDTSSATLTINIGDAPNRITFIPEIGDGTIVREPHLPARGGEPSGSQFDGNAETTGGTITFNSPDGVGSVTISGVVLTPGALPQQVSSNATGTLVITGYAYNPVTGVGSITYVYTLNDNTLNTNGESLSFPVVVTDLDGDVANDNLVINIVDDAPLAANDSGTQGSENAPVSVNVFVNDTPGADGVSLINGVAVVAGSLTGAGTLSYNNNGSFTYTPALGEEGVVSFQYTITDGDGDTSTANVTINLLKDSSPQVDVAGGNMVDEAGLPAGSDATANSETTSGTISTATGGDTLVSLVINGVNVTTGGTVVGASGTLTISVSEGVYSYSYTLTDNTSGDTATDSFNVVITDIDGDSASDTLVIGIQDDVPTAANDTDTIAPGTYGPATGNVITDAEGDGGADTQGADGATVTAVTGSAAGTVDGSTNGTYGVLTLNADGSYSYARNPGTAGGVSDVFTYTLTDGDGDTSTATLTIRISDSPTTLDLPTGEDDGTRVAEAGLPAGSDAASNSETTSGTIAYTAPDGPATVTIDGVAVISVGQTFLGTFGTLTVTSIVNGSVGYDYTLTTNTPGDATFEDFAIIISDQDGDTTEGNLVIDIVDDVPTARADVDSVTEDGATVADGNVITGANVADTNTTDGVADTPGADGATVTAISFGATEGTIGTSLASTYGTLTMNADGSYSYALNNANAAVQGLDGNDTLTEVFTYTITDGDGDPSTTTLTVTINGSDDPITINGLNAEGPDRTVDEDDLSDGSSPNAAALTQTGSFTINGVDGIASIKIGGTETSVGQSFTTAYGTFTITSISAPANGTATAITVGYRYVLIDNTAHANANGQNFVTELFDVAVTDTDGSTDTDQVEVRIIDDVPTAANDTDTVAGGSNAPATGNVITDAELDGGKDTAGADGVVVTAITGVAAGTVGGTTNGTYGVLTLNANGSYSYVRNDGTPGNVQDVFTYQITDSDGDTSTATLTITIQDDRPVVGPNAIVLLDDDALTGGNPDGTGDDVNSANATGTLSGSGGDGALAFAYQLTGAPTGFSYVAGPSGSVLVQQGATTVLTITLNSSTGAYTVTQNAPIVHATGDNENNAPFTLNYTVTDVDGDPASGTLSINVDDDTPVAANDTDSVKEDGPLQAIGNVLTGVGSDANAAGADKIGADGAAVGGAVVAVTGGTVGTPIVGTYGSLTLNSNGSYTYTLDNGNAAIQALDVGETLTQSYTYTIRDADGDTTTALLTITINGTNDAPVAVADTNWTIEDAAAAVTGNVLNTVAHLGAPDSAVRGDVADTDVDVEALSVTTTGVQNGTYGTLTLNADGSYSYKLYTQAENAAAFALVQARDVGDAPLSDVFNYSITDRTASAGSTLTISVFGANDAPVANNDTNWVLDVTSGANPTASGNVLSTMAHLGAPDAAVRGDVADTDVDVETLTVTTTGTFNGTYGTLVLNANGTYTYTLNANNAAVNALDTNETLVEFFGYTASDGTATANATLTITVFGTNDAPVAVGDTNWTIEDAAAAVTGNVLNTVAHLGAPDSAVRGDVADTDVDVEALSVTTTGVQNGTYGTLTLNADGSYSYKLYTQAENAAAFALVQARDVGDAPLSDVFNYSITDGTAAAASTLTISVFGANDAPVVRVATAIVSEEGLANGRIDSTGVDPDLTNDVVATGTIVITDVDGDAQTVTLGDPGAVLTADGAPVTWSGVGTGTIIGSVGSTEVIRVAITNTGGFTVTLSQSIDHPNITGEDLKTFTVPVNVNDGTVTVSSTLTVIIEDDSPTAVNDSPTTIEGAAAFGGNVLSNDFSGADTPAAVTSIGSSAIGANTVVAFGSFGSLTINASGAYTYTPNASVPSGSIDTFTYTMRDADGDTSTATLAITFAGDANGPTASNVTASVDDDGLAGNNPASTTGDLADPQPAGDASEATFVSNLGFNFGLDGAAASATDFVFTTTTGLVGEETVSYSWSDVTSTLTATVTVGRVGTVLFDVVVNQLNGDYKLTLRDNVIHSAGGNENDALASLTYTVTDSDGSTATGSLAITFDDDAPTASPDTNTVVEGATVTGNILIGGAADVFGADGPDVTVPVGGITGIRAAVADLTTAVTNGATSVTTALGTLTLSANGSYTYAARANAIGANAVDTFVYTIRDADGDLSTTTLTINLNNVTVTATDTDALVNEAGLPVGSNPSADSELFTSAITPFGGVGGYTYTLNSPATGTYGNLVLNTNGTYTYTLTSSFDTKPDANNGTNTEQNRDSFGYTVTDANGNTTTGTILVDIVDDVPTLGVVQSQQANNNPLQAPAVGTLHFNDGADGTGPVANITANTTGLASGGLPVLTSLSGNVLTGYVNTNGTAGYQSGVGGDTAVFTLTVDPAVSSGQYVFDLITALDPTVTDVPIGSGSSFGVGPSNSVIVTDNATAQQLVYVTGWSPTSGFTAAEQTAWLAGGSPVVTQTSNVNGSTQGWGLANNNFDAGEFLRFDFGALNDYDGAGAYSPPVGTGPMANASYATFSFFNFNAGETIKFVAHYVDGAPQSFVIDGANDAGTFKISAPAGTLLAWIDVYQSDGDMKLNLTNVGVALSSIDKTIAFTVQLSDGDGDLTSANAFSVRIADALSPFLPAAPVVLDLDGDGVEFLSTAAGVTFDYQGDGTPESTAWVSGDDGLLALDRNGDGVVNNGSEIVFARDGLTDLQGLAADYDSNDDGVLNASDAEFAKFGVWQDANSNGVTDAGEFRSLSDAGIVSIKLVSDGIAYSAANGSVSVAGQSVYTKADGSTGILADAAFATGGTSTTTARTSEEIRSGNVTASVIAAALVGLAVENNAVAAPDDHLAKTVTDESGALVAANDVESVVSASQRSAATPLSFDPIHDGVQHTSDVASTSRAADDAEDISNFQDAPTSQLSDLLTDSNDMVSSDTSGPAFSFGGDQVMHSMLDMAAFAPSVDVASVSAIPLPAEDAVRDAMPDMMVDRLIDAFSGDVKVPANDTGGAGDSHDVLAGILTQGIDAFNISAMANNDVSGSHQYDMATINHA